MACGDPYSCVAEDLDEPPAAELMRNNANSGADELEPVPTLALPYTIPVRGMHWSSPRTFV